MSRNPWRGMAVERFQALGCDGVAEVHFCNDGEKEHPLKAQEMHRCPHINSWDLIHPASPSFRIHGIYLFDIYLDTEGFESFFT
jgi:hypothetical protein